MTVWTPPSAAIAASSGSSSSGMSTSTAAPAATARTTYALLPYGPIGPILTTRIPPSSNTVISAPATGPRLGGPLPSRRRFPGISFRGGLGSESGLEGTFLRLVLLAFRDRSDIRKGRPVGGDALPSRRPHAKVLGRDPDHDPRLGGTETGQRGEPPLQLLRILGLGPDPGGVAAVFGGDDLAEPVDALRHAHREAVQGGRRLERLLDCGRIHACDLHRVDGAQSFAHTQRTLERPLDRHLLIEAEADQQRGGVLADESIRISVASPLELRGRRHGLGHACTVPRGGPGLRDTLATAYTRRMSWLGRLFGAKPPAAPLNSVVVASDLVQPLTVGGADLSTAVDAALRAFLDARAKALAAGEPERLPFWLRRDVEHAGDLEDELRDRVIQRHAAEEEAH